MEELQTWSELGAFARDLAWKMSLDTGARLSPVNLAAFVALCLAIYLVRRPGGSFLAWLFPARIYRTRTFWLDLKIFLLNQVIRVFIVMHFAAVSGAAAAAVFWLAGPAEPDPALSRPVLVALIALLTADFVTYWYHRLHHDLPWLWPIHALHHSAEELNPVTAYRHHPVFEVFGTLAAALATGLVQGLLLTLLVGSLDIVTLGGANAFFAAFNLFASNLRHSHVWLRYPRVIEHVLISPAQHQVHHSIDPRHHDRNYGEIFAIWDWMFGTLYVPRGREAISFGIADAEGVRIAQPHPDLRQALWTPLRDIGAMLRRRGAAHDAKAGTEPGGTRD